MDKTRRILLLALAFSVLSIPACPALPITAETEENHMSDDDMETFSSTVMDGETGETLPFAQIYISEGRGTIANAEGRFSVKALPSETLVITCMGYQRMKIKAADLPPTLRLMPAETAMREVTVMAPGNILAQVVKQMEKDYQAHKNAYTYYYMRQTYRMDEAAEMAEAYLSARSAGNLRGVEFLAGRVFHAKSKEKKLALDFSNLHATLSLAPMIKEEPFWQEVFIPLNQKSFRNRYNYEKDYETDISPQTDADGKRILCIHIRRPQKGKKVRKAVMSGDLYVEADSLWPIGFRGKIEGLKLESELNGEESTAKATLDLNITYSRTHGYNKVTSIFTRLKCKGIDCQTIAYHVDNLDIPDDADANRSDNLLTAIWYTRKDAEWWRKNIILPTEAERKLMRENGMMQEEEK